VEELLLLNVYNVSDVRQIEVHTAEPLVPGPSRLEVEIATSKLKKYKSRGSDEIATEVSRSGGEILLSVIHKLITSIWSKEEFPDQWESIIVPVHKKGNITDCNNYRGISNKTNSVACVIPADCHCICYAITFMGFHV
jgi:hypothetical protein